MILRPDNLKLKRSVTLLLGLVVLIGLNSCRSRSASQTRTRVRIAVPDSGFAYLPVFIAQEMGYYGHQGLDTTLEAVYGGGSKSMQAIPRQCGLRWNFARTRDTVGRRGAPRPVVCDFDRPAELCPCSFPRLERKVRTLKDLAGAAVGVASPGSGSHNFPNYVLATHKVPIAQVSIVGIGLGVPAIAALNTARLMREFSQVTPLRQLSGASHDELFWRILIRPKG